MADEKIIITIEANSEDAKKKLNEFQRALDDVDNTSQKTGKGFDNLGTKLSKLGKGMQDVGRNLTVTLSLPLLAFAKNVVQVGSELTAFEETYKVSLGSMGSTATDFANVYSKTVGMTSTQVRQQVLEFNKFAKAMGMSSEEAFEFSKSMLQLTNDLSAYFDVEVTEATDAMKSALMGNYQAVDKLGLAFGKTTIESQMLQMGLEGAFHELDSNTQLWVLYELGAKQGADANGQAARESENFAGKTRELKGALEELYQKVFVQIQPELLAMVQGITDVVNAFKSLTPEQLKAIAVIGAIIGIIGPLLIYFGMLIDAIGKIGIGFVALGGGIKKVGGWFTGTGEGVKSLAGVLEKTTKGFSKMGKFITGLSPTTLIIAAIVAVVVALGVAIYKNWDKVKPILDKMMNKFKEMGASISNAIKPIIDKVLTVFVGMWEIIKKVVSSVVDTIKGRLVSIATIFSPLLEVIKTLINTVILLAGTIFAIGSAIFSFVWGIIKIIGTIIWGIVELIISVVMVIASWIGVLIAYLMPVIGVVLQIGGVFFTVFMAIISVITYVAGVVFELLVGAIMWVAAIVVQFISGVIVKAFEIFNGIIGIVGMAFAGLTWIFSTVSEAIANAISSMVDKIKGWIDGFIAKVDDFKNSWSNAWSMAKDQFKSFIDGVKELWKGITNLKIPKLKVTGKLSWTKDGITIPKLSWFAKGGIATGPSVVGIGEAGDEAIVPLSNKSKMLPFAKAVAEMMPNNSTENSSSGDVVNINVSSVVIREEADIQKFAKEIVKLQDKKARAKGGLIYG